MCFTIEKLHKRHKDDLLKVLNYYIENSFAAYPEAPVGDERFRRYISYAGTYPGYMIYVEGEVAGFAMLRPHYPSASFLRTAEITCFLLPDFTGSGIGRTMYEKLCAMAVAMDVDTILANVSSHNTASQRFHEKMGFEECGRFRNIGRKWGTDFDVVWYQKFV